MNRRRITFWIPVIASLLFVASSVVTASAQSAAAGTTLTFSAPVRLPGITLPAGTYLFQDAEFAATPAVSAAKNLPAPAATR